MFLFPQYLLQNLSGNNPLYAFFFSYVCRGFMTGRRFLKLSCRGSFSSPFPGHSPLLPRAAITLTRKWQLTFLKRHVFFSCQKHFLPLLHPSRRMVIIGSSRSAHPTAVQRVVQQLVLDDYSCVWKGDCHAAILAGVFKELLSVTHSGELKPDALSWG